MNGKIILILSAVAVGMIALLTTVTEVQSLAAAKRGGGSRGKAASRGQRKRARTGRSGEERKSRDWERWWPVVAGLAVRCHH